MKPKRAAIALLAGAGLFSGCIDNRYYVRTDNSDDVLAGVTSLKPPARSPAQLTLGATFKSAGAVQPSASDTLYESVRGGLSRKGQWDVRRLGRAADDFAPLIAAISAAAGHPPAPAGAGQTPRLLVLVENRPDLSSRTHIDYFFSGLSLGAYSTSHPADRYDITIAYRDPQGQEHLYRNHQDLVFVSGSTVFGHDERAVAGLRRYGSAEQAFNRIVSNSVAGDARGTVTVGAPRFDAVRR